MSDSIYILGTALSHDGSSCIMKDGKIIVAIEKERITRKKNDGFNDNETIRYCLEVAGIDYNDLCLIVEKNTFNPLKTDDLEKRKNRVLPPGVPIISISHHLAHAYSAVGTSPFEEMGVVVVDGQGCSMDTCIDIFPTTLPLQLRNIDDSQRYLYWENASYYIFKSGKMVPIHKDFSRWVDRKNRLIFPVATWNIENFLGEFYEGIAHYIFNEHNCAGKLMGLAPYGKHNSISWEPFLYEQGRVFLKTDWWSEIDPFKGGAFYSLKDKFQYYANLAYWAQVNLEKAIKYLFDSYYDMYPMDNVAYAGGVALNAVANHTILTHTKFTNTYIQPAAADNGLSLGCCYYGWLEVLDKKKVTHCGSTFFGKKYSEYDIHDALNKHDKYIEYKHEKNVTEIAANMLAAGKVIAWFQGRSEFGPRALGNRSILADPRIINMQEHINKNIKFREDFRPFAPSVLADEASKYFNINHDSNYMLVVAKVKKKWQKAIPSVVHVDGSARVQTVKEELAPKYYELIKRFKELTDIPILLNTSLNIRGMPIVETPHEVIELYLSGKIDYLIIDNIVVKKI